ncbi:MAG TPA: peroxiredoxin-like family protein [Solirubrobacteraceae bacterium]
MIATTLAGVTLPDHAGRAVTLGELWGERPAALVWLRHYGCMYCRAHAVALQRARPEFEQAGLTVTLIGMGTAQDAATFRRQLALDIAVLADGAGESYRAAGAKTGGVIDLVGPKVVLRAVPTLLKSRVGQGRTVGNPAQLGAAAVIAPGDEVLFAHAARDASDNAAPAALLGAVAPAR